jgi:CHAD domain-containing protein
MGQQMRQTLEREFKLEAHSGFALPELPGRPLEREVLVSTYYDTPDLRLAAFGITLRRREQRRGPAWQLKIPRDDAHGETRIELEVDAPDELPPHGLTRLVSAHTRGQPLRKAAILQTDRSGVRVRGLEGDIADVVVDEVTAIVDGRATVSFTEIEAELLSDDGAALQQLRRVLLGAGAITGETRPKLLQVLDIPAPTAHPQPLPGDPTSIHIRAHLATQLRNLIARDPGTRLGDDPEELHQLRVATRRLRALLRTTRPVLLGDWAPLLEANLSWLGRALGPVRDADVLLERFEGRASALSPGLQAPFLQALGPITQARDTGRSSLMIALDAPRYFELLDGLERAELHASVDDRGPDLADLARKEFRRLKKRVHGLGERPSDDQLHAVRILGKRARYATEFAAPTMTRDAAPFVRCAKKLQDVLGEHQDSCIAEVQLWQLAAAVRDTDAAFAAGVVVERERHEGKRAREDFPAAWRDLKQAAKNLWD